MVISLKVLILGWKEALLHGVIQGSSFLAPSSVILSGILLTSWSKPGLRQVHVLFKGRGNSVTRQAHPLKA